MSTHQMNIVTPSVNMSSASNLTPRNKVPVSKEEKKTTKFIRPKEHKSYKSVAKVLLIPFIGTDMRNSVASKDVNQPRG